MSIVTNDVLFVIYNDILEKLAYRYDYTIFF